MIRHCFLLILRNFKRNKSSFLINLIGLSSGLTCAVLIALWITDELQMDRFHQQKIYQVMQNEHLSDAVNTVDGTPGILAEALAMEFPEVKHAVTTSPVYWLGHSKVGNAEHPDVIAAGKFAGADFFKIFSYPLLSGNINKVLTGSKTVAISETLAKKLFKTTDVLGKAMVWSNSEIAIENHALISGVFKDIPANSSERFDFLVSADMMLNLGNSTYRKWGNYGPSTYLVLHNNEDITRFNTKIKDFLKTKGLKKNTLFVRPYADSYLYNQMENGKVSGGRIDYVKLFAFAAFLILLIACINFTNLSTARASKRLKEIGVKKVLGVQRSALVMQYLMESILLSFIALFVSLLVVELMLPSFNGITGKHLSLHFNTSLTAILLAITLFTGFIAGIYPALYLSGLKPITALRDKLQLGRGALWTHRGLVVFQFAFSGVLIVAVLVVYKQIQYVQNKSQGFQKDNVLYFEPEAKLKENIPSAIEAIRQMDGVVNAAGINRELLGDLSYTTGDFNWEGRDPKEAIRFQRADVTAGLLETLDMKMADGRSFSPKFGSDSAGIIINEAGIKAMRLQNPVGKIFKLWGNDFQIIGVVKDFHFESMHKKVGPMFIQYKPDNANRIMVRVHPGKLKEVIAELKQLNNQYNPGYNFNYKFLDQDFQLQYISETRMALLSRYFAILAIVISCLGLFGLATFTAERRYKEIGIRKVLGATDWNVIYILLSDFVRPVLFSILISIPIAYLLCLNWLSSFVYRINLEWWFFGAAAIIALLISLMTVFFQAYRSARMNPVSSLKAD